MISNRTEIVRELFLVTMITFFSPLATANAFGLSHGPRTTQEWFIAGLNFEEPKTIPNLENSKLEDLRNYLVLKCIRHFCENTATMLDPLVDEQMEMIRGLSDQQFTELLIGQGVPPEQIDQILAAKKARGLVKSRLSCQNPTYNLMILVVDTCIFETVLNIRPLLKNLPSANETK